MSEEGLFRCWDPRDPRDPSTTGQHPHRVLLGEGPGDTSAQVPETSVRFHWALPFCRFPLRIYFIFRKVRLRAENPEKGETGTQVRTFNLNIVCEIEYHVCMWTIKGHRGLHLRGRALGRRQHAGRHPPPPAAMEGLRATPPAPALHLPCSPAPPLPGLFNSDARSRQPGAQQYWDPQYFRGT